MSNCAACREAEDKAAARPVEAERLSSAHSVKGKSSSEALKKFVVWRFVAALNETCAGVSGVCVCEAFVG